MLPERHPQGLPSPPVQPPVQTSIAAHSEGLGGEGGPAEGAARPVLQDSPPPPRTQPEDGGGLPPGKLG